MLSSKQLKREEEGGMRVQLAQQAKEILGTSDLVMITERVDDVALLIGQMVKMGLPEVLDLTFRTLFRTFAAIFEEPPVEGGSGALYGLFSCPITHCCYTVLPLITTSCKL
jgi:hypothetical protein